MTGKSIPRRYSKINQNTKTTSRIEKSAVHFRSLQEFSATKPFMDPTISAKVLGDGLKSSGSGDGKERTSGPDGDEYDGPVIKLDWNPRAKRKPGQILKLHASYRELTSKEGAKWGWVDPPKEVSAEDSARFLQQAIEWKKKQPKAVLKLYKNTSHGTHELEPVKEINIKTLAESFNFENSQDFYSGNFYNALSEIPLEFKQLGQTIGQILPGQRIDLARAVGRGLVVDANGKFRCPSGTPNANLGGGGMVGVRLSGNSTPIPCRAALDTQTQLSGAPYKNYTRYDAACRCLEGACSVLGVVRLKGNVLGLDNLTTGDIPAVDAMFISMSKENRLILPRIRSEMRG